MRLMSTVALTLAVCAALRTHLKEASNAEATEEKKRVLSPKRDYGTRSGQAQHVGRLQKGRLPDEAQKQECLRES